MENVISRDQIRAVAENYKHKPYGLELFKNVIFGFDNIIIYKGDLYLIISIQGNGDQIEFITHPILGVVLDKKYFG